MRVVVGAMVSTDWAVPGWVEAVIASGSDASYGGPPSGFAGMWSVGPFCCSGSGSENRGLDVISSLTELCLRGQQTPGSVPEIIYR